MRYTWQLKSGSWVTGNVDKVAAVATNVQYTDPAAGDVLFTPLCYCDNGHLWPLADRGLTTKFVDSVTLIKEIEDGYTQEASDDCC